ncbi:MAG: hypothetical protein COA49_08680 [Bacteroidetes bacterium]|nr:MAG: hypothetical protein COA49_08680 [Bacteroidota bacterium]
MIFNIKPLSISVLYALAFTIFTPIAVSSQTTILTAENVLELALSSPVFLNESTAKLHKAQGELETARRWWVPSTTIGATSFSHTGNALNSNGVIFTDVVAKSADLGMGLSFNANSATGFSGVKSSKYALDATVQEVRAERDLFVLACMNAYISATSATNDYVFHLIAVEELRDFEKQFESLVGLGLRPQSDVLIARTERMQMESKVLMLEAALVKMLTELRAALGMPVMPEVDGKWPSIESLLGISIASNSMSREYIQSNPPARQALTYRVEEAKSERSSLTKDIWMPELRFSPMIGTLGRDFSSSSLSITSEWVASLVLSFPLDNLFHGGKKKEADAKIDLYSARVSEWDLRNQAYRDGSTARIELLKKALNSQLESVYASDLALEDAYLRLSHGLVDSMEIMQIERLRLESHSKAISLKEEIIKLEFELITLTNPQWTNVVLR